LNRSIHLSIASEKAEEELTMHLKKVRPMVPSIVNGYYIGKQLHSETVRAKILGRAREFVKNARDLKECKTRLHSVISECASGLISESIASIEKQLNEQGIPRIEVLVSYPIHANAISVNTGSSAGSTLPIESDKSNALSLKAGSVAALGAGTGLALGSATMGNLGFYQLATIILSQFGTFSFGAYTGLTAGISAIGGPVVAGALASVVAGFAVGLLAKLGFSLFSDWRGNLLRKIDEWGEKSETKAQIAASINDAYETHRKKSTDLIDSEIGMFERNTKIEMEKMLERNLREILRCGLAIKCSKAISFSLVLFQPWLVHRKVTNDQLMPLYFLLGSLVVFLIVFTSVILA